MFGTCEIFFNRLNLPNIGCRGARRVQARDHAPRPHGHPIETCIDIYDRSYFERDCVTSLSLYRPVRRRTSKSYPAPREESSRDNEKESNETRRRTAIALLSKWSSRRGTFATVFFLNMSLPYNCSANLYADGNKFYEYANTHFFSPKTYAYNFWFYRQKAFLYIA